MKYYKEKLEEMYSFFSSMRDKYNLELRSCPKGSLNCFKRDGKCSFFHSYKSGGRIIRKGITKEPEMIRRLARKHYVLKALAIVNENLKGLKCLMNRFEDLEFETVAKKLPKSCRSLGTEFFLAAGKEIISRSRNEYLNWGDESYEMSRFMPESRTKVTSWGLKVRSKSELLIAEFLRMREVPFRYEQILKLEGLEFAPDFTLLRKDGKIIYWEHLGLPNDREYMQAFFRKLAIYIRNGIVPGDNLIITFDGRDGNIDMDLIDSTVRSYMQ